MSFPTPAGECLLIGPEKGSRERGARRVVIISIVIVIISVVIVISIILIILIIRITIMISIVIRTISRL